MEGIGWALCGLIAFVIVALIVSVVGSIVHCINSYDIDDLEFTCTVMEKYIDNGQAYLIVACDDVVKNVKVDIDQYASVQPGDTCVILAKGWHDGSRGDQYTFEFLYKTDKKGN